MPFNPAWPEAIYYNPTTNRIPTSILSNHFNAALQEAETNVFDGIENVRYHDVQTTWLGIELKPVTVPILPVQQMTLAEAREKLKAAKAAKKASK